MGYDVKIEVFNFGHPNYHGSQFLTILNNSDRNYDLAGWKVVYQSLHSKKELHRHNFYKLRNGAHFAPGERIFLISSLGQDHFSRAGEEKLCAIPHWDFFTDTDKTIYISNCKVTLYDSTDNIIDFLCAEQYKTRAEEEIARIKPVIFIGHGRKADWKELKDHLSDKHGFEVNCYESKERAGKLIPDIINDFQAHIAFIIFTAEDETTDGGKRARQNVVDEFARFQTKLGKNKVIPIVENGVTMPSNLFGIHEMRFDSGRIREIFGDVISVINREFKLY